VHYLELVYSYSHTLYDLIPHSPHPLDDPSTPTLELGFVSNKNTSSSHAQTSKVNTIQSNSSQQPIGNIKNNGKSKKSSNEEDNPKYFYTQPTRNPKSPCIIF
jgi:hypothetical protein